MKIAGITVFDHALFRQVGTVEPDGRITGQAKGYRGPLLAPVEPPRVRAPEEQRALPANPDEWLLD